MAFTEGYIQETSAGGWLLRVWQMRVPPFQRPFRAHHHVPFEIVEFTHGNGIYRTGQASYDIQAGDVFVFASNEVHCITETGTDGLAYWNLHFEPRYLWGSRYDSLSPAHQTFCKGHAETFSNRLPRNHPATEQIRQLLSEIRTEMESQKSEYGVMVRGRIMEIAVSLIRELGYFTEQTETPFSPPRLLAIKAAVDYVLSHYTESLTLEEVAEAARLTPNYLSTLFHKTMGVSLWDYVTEKRIDRALNLLDSDQTLTVLHVALACGFNSTASFNKAFRLRIGTTPSAYRKLGLGMLEY